MAIAIERLIEDMANCHDEICASEMGQLYEGMLLISKDAANALVLYLKGQLIYSNTNLKLAKTEREIASAKEGRQHIKDLISLLTETTAPPQPTPYK